MTEASADAPLKWDLFVTSGVPTATKNPPPGEKRRFFSPISSTLIYGKRDAVLVDTFMTVDQNDVLVDWVKGSGKNLTAIYITHGHGDHWFGIGGLLERFPGARAVASPAVVRMMKEQPPEVLRSWWHERLPGQIPERLVIAEELAGNVIKLEGHDLVMVESGTPTRTTPPSCTCPPSGWSSRETPPTMAFTSCSPSPIRRSDASGSPRSTKSKRSNRAR